MDQLKQVLLDKFGLNEEKAQPILDGLVYSMDDNEIHYSDFLAAMVSTHITMHNDHLISTFKKFDTGDTGRITYECMQSVLGHDFTEEELTEIFSMLDRK